MRKLILFLGVLLLTLGLVVGSVGATLHVVKDADNTYILYEDEAGNDIMKIDDDDGVTITSYTAGNTYTTMTLTSTLAASSLTAGSFVTPGGIACAKQLFIGDDIDMSVSGTGTYELVLKDSVADALSIKAGATDIVVFATDTHSVTITPVTTIAGLLTSGGGITVGASGAGFDVTFYGDNVGSDFVWDQDGDTNVGTLTLGANTDGVDFKVFSLTTGNYLLWDQSTDDLLLVGTATQLHIAGTTTSTTPTTGSLKTAGGLGVAGTVNIGGTLTVSTDGAGTDVKIYGTTSSYYILFDADADDNGSLYIGADTKGILTTLYGDVTGCGVFWNPSTDTNGTLSVGATGGSKGVDFVAYGATNGNYMHWDRSGDDLLIVGTSTKVDIAGSTESTSVTSGALSVDGGLGVAKDFFLGGDMSIATAKKITTVAELTLNSVNPLTIQFGGVDWLQMDEGAISGFAAEDDAAGHAVYIESEDGGVDGGTASTGMVGGAISLKTGEGSAAVTTNAVGGAGGAFTLTTGVGLTGNGTGSGGVGGAVGITAGAGGNSGAGVGGTGGTGGSITLTAGAGGAAGGGTAGAPGKVDIAAGLLHMAVQTIGMNDATVITTLVPGTPTGTLITGNILYVDAEGNIEILKLPHEADADGVLLIIVNTGGETITIQNDAGGALLTLGTTETALVACDGTTWRGAVCVL